LGIVAATPGAIGVGLAVGAMLGGSSGGKLGNTEIGIVLGFIMAVGVVVVFSVSAGGAIGTAVYRLRIWQTLNQGGKVGCISGIVVATPVAISLGSTGTRAEIVGDLGEKLAGDIGALIGLALEFTIIMGTILIIGFSVGGAIGHVIYRFFDRNLNKYAA
jgi:uncharacterized membrane protein YbhN (UPF0104 family)